MWSLEEATGSKNNMKILTSFRENFSFYLESCVSARSSEKMLVGENEGSGLGNGGSGERFVFSWKVEALHL